MTGMEKSEAISLAYFLAFASASTRVDFLSRGFCRNGFLNPGRMNQAVDQHTTVGKIRPQNRRFFLAEMHPENPVYLAHTAGMVVTVTHDFLQ